MLPPLSPGTEILDETDSTGSFTNSAFSEYIYFEGKRIARRDASGDVFYYTQDDLGTTDGMVEIAAGDTSEQICYDADFYPYGGENVFTNTCPQNYKFEGKERDETGNDDFGARYYSSVYGRWLSPDWSAIPAPVPYANMNNPQTLNLYAMVGDNPETFADLDGHGCDDGSAGEAPCTQPTSTPPGSNGTPPEWHEQQSTAGAYHQDNQQNGPQHPGHDSSGNPQDQKTGQSTGTQDSGVKAPPGKPNAPPPPGTGPNGEPNEWEEVAGTQDKQYGPKYKPKYPIPDGSQPQILWDPHDGWWSLDTGKPGAPREHYDRWWNKLNMQDAPTIMDRLKALPPKPIAALGTTAVVIYIIVDIGSRILVPARNAVPWP